MAAVCTATVRRAPDHSLAYVRIAPGVANGILGYVPDGLGRYQVPKLKLDSTGFAWLRLQFTGGSSGWVSSDRLDIQGDCSPEGYGVVTQPTQASTLKRTDPGTPPPPPVPPPALPPPPVTDTSDRIRKAAFNITTGFEGGTYVTYQNYDAGIVSYGRFGFTLASGSLASVLDLYIDRLTSPVSTQLRIQYQSRVTARDASLRNDTNFRDLLIKAALDTIMQAAQDQVATDEYWTAIQTLSAQPRGIVLPLSQAFLFDTGINSGVYHDMITTAEVMLNVPQRSRVGANGITEQQLIAKVAQICRDRLYSIANSQNLPGLKPRGDFWVNIVASGDWTLQGDLSGNVTIKPGMSIQVRHP